MIRNVLESDVKQIVKIYNHYILNTIITFEESPIDEAEMLARINQRTESLPWLVYESEGRIMGYAYGGMWNKRIGYRYSAESTIYLDKDCAGAGIGTQLYGSLIEHLKLHEFRNVIGGIALPNAASVALHEKLGYIKVAHYKNIGIKFGRWLDVAYYQLEL
jgi:phosphinothricin acetyltransferase